MDMYRSKGFSFIEVLLVLSLSSVVILIFIQNISIVQKFLNNNLQDVFNDKSDNYISRGAISSNNLLLFDLLNSIGKRDCSIDKPESFQNIVIPEYHDINNGEVVALSMLGEFLFAGMNSSTSSDPDFITVNMTNWKKLNSLNTGPGISGMTMQGHYVFLANTSVNAQFQVVDISNPNNPILIDSLKIPGSNSKHNPIITSITSNITNENKARIYLGTQKSDIGEIFIADFNGTSFNYISSYDTGSIVNDLFANKSGLWATSPSDNELFHYNSIGTKDYVFNADGQSGNGKRIDIIGEKFKILGRTVGHDELVQIDGPSKKIGGTINDLLVNIDSSGVKEVLILTNISGSSIFQIWDTSDGLINKLIKSVALPVNANRFVCSKDSIIIGTASSSAPFLIFRT